MKKRILLVNQSVNFLTIDIANAMLMEYDEVVLMAGSVTNFERPLDEHIKVSKVVKYNRSSAIKRILTWSIGFIQIFCKILFCYRDFNVLYFSNPPMSYFGAVWFKNKFSIVVYDIYPDSLKNIGIQENSPIFKYWVKKNKKTYCQAERIFTLSKSMADSLARYVDKGKIEIIPNWSASEKLRPIAKQSNTFIREHQLEEKFIVMYSGNMGYTHSVDVLVDVAEKMRNNKKVQFLLIGQGKQRPILEERVKKSQLSNCTFMDFLPFDVFPSSLASADLALITLNEQSGAVSVPGKTYDLLAVGAPLLCICPPESEMNHLVFKYHNGKCFQAHQVTEIMEYIIEVASDNSLQKILSENSLNASKDFTKENAKKYVSII